MKGRGSARETGESGRIMGKNQWAMGGFFCVPPAINPPPGGTIYFPPYSWAEDQAWADERGDRGENMRFCGTPFRAQVLTAIYEQFVYWATPPLEKTVLLEGVMALDMSGQSAMTSLWTGGNQPRS
jgi:hypothetical protein